MTGGGGVPRIFHRRRQRGFIVGGGAASAASDRIRQHWNSALAGHVFFWFYRGQLLHPWSPLGRWRQRVTVTVNSICMLCAQFHCRNELIVHCLISGGSYKCNVECRGDAESAGVENAELKNAGLENAGIKNMPSFEWLNERTRKKQCRQVCCVARFVIPVDE